jgi:hypothetical protein
MNTRIQKLLEELSIKNSDISNDSISELSNIIRNMLRGKPEAIASINFKKVLRNKLESEIISKRQATEKASFMIRYL